MDEPRDWKNPLRRTDVQSELERVSRAFLREHGGTGQVSLTVDFHDWTAVQYVVTTKGRRVPLTRDTRRR